MPHFTQGEGDEFVYGGDELARELRSRVADVFADVAALDPALPESFPQALPVEAAVTWGNCLLFTGEAPWEPFPDWLAVPAVERLTALLGSAIEQAGRLPADWDMAGSDEAEDLVAGLLEARMDSWAALEAIDTVGDVPNLVDRIMACEEVLAQFDRALEGRVEFLATLADTQLLANWRMSLAEPYRDPLPWWLDGRLEATAAEVDRFVLAMERDLFGPKFLVMPTTNQADFRGIREGVVQACAAAADVSPSGTPSLTPLLQWQSPDGMLAAALLPPPSGPSISPDKLVVRFAVVGDASVACLRGGIAVLGNARALIEVRTIDDEDVALADFPAEFVIGSSKHESQAALSLTVWPDGQEWEPVDPGGRK